MGTEYCLGNHGTEETPQGTGVSLLAYEMSGTFDVYADVPKDKVELDAWDNAHRINLWANVDPIKLYKIGKNFMEIANKHMTPEEYVEAELKVHMIR